MYRIQVIHRLTTSAGIDIYKEDKVIHLVADRDKEGCVTKQETEGRRTEEIVTGWPGMRGEG